MNHREAVRTGVTIAFVSLVSYALGASFTGFFHSASAGTGGMWAVMSGNVVLQATRRETWSSAWLQILGTFAGAIVSAAYLSVLSFSVAGLAGAVFVTVILCHVFRIPDHARLAALAVSVVMVVSS